MPRNSQLAWTWLAEADRHGHPKASFYLGTLATQGGWFEIAMDWFIRSAGRGYDVRIEFKKLAKLIDYEKTLSEDIEDFCCLHKEAKDFLEFYDWCIAILDSYVGMYYSGILAVFLFRIHPGRSNVDEWIWVITGDLPPAYITCEDSPNAACALDAYIGAMTEWAEAARAGESVAQLIPVNVPATRENADALQGRLDMLDDRVLRLYRDDLQSYEHAKARRPISPS